MPTLASPGHVPDARGGREATASPFAVNRFLQPGGTSSVPIRTALAPVRARLLEHGIAAWAIIGYLQAIGDEVTPKTIAKIAEDYLVPVTAVTVALADYVGIAGVLKAFVADHEVDEIEDRAFAWMHREFVRPAARGSARAELGYPGMVSGCVLCLPPRSQCLS